MRSKTMLATLAGAVLASIWILAGAAPPEQSFNRVNFVSGLSDTARTVYIDYYTTGPQLRLTDPTAGSVLLNDLVTGASVDSIQDADNDTKVQVEESADEDIIRFDAGGTEHATIRSTGFNVDSIRPLTGNGSTDGTAIFTDAANEAWFEFLNDGLNNPRIYVHGDGSAANEDASITHIGGSGTNRWEFRSGESQEVYSAVSALSLITSGVERISSAGAATFTQTDTDNLRMDGNTISSTDTDGPIAIVPNGAGVITGPGGNTLFDASGEIPDARLSANVPLLDAAANTFTGTIGIGGAATSPFEIFGNGGALAHRSFSATAGSSAYFAFTRSRHATLGSHTIVASGDSLGRIFAQGSDGSNYDNAASIQFEVDGTPAAGTDMPGRILFLTSPDGSATLAERLRIENNGQTGIGAAAPAARLEVETISTEATAAILIDQDDTDMPLIKIEATETASAPSAVTATLTTYDPAGTVVGPTFDSGGSVGWQFAGMVLIDVNGSPRYMPTYTYTEP